MYDRVAREADEAARVVRRVHGCRLLHSEAAREGVSGMGSLPGRMPQLRPGSVTLGRLDELGWLAGTSLEAYGLRFGVRTNATGLLDGLEALLPPGWRPCPSPLVDQMF